MGARAIEIICLGQMLTSRFSAATLPPVRIIVQDKYKDFCVISTDLSKLGLRRGHFEIHFPKRFTRVLKLMQLSPYRWYFALVHKSTKL